mmetsp:Transcript_28789/g.25482  ORF Transcript_28789/g.25482 Transcript_28789/m.25482 type:complete len:87 (+) Transcript_28789:98-358(+)
MLYYLIKIRTTGGVRITIKNWKPLILTSLNLTAKFCNDYWFKNKDFSRLTKIYSWRRINSYERRFLKQIDYRLYIDSQDMQKLNQN